MSTEKRNAGKVIVRNREKKIQGNTKQIIERNTEKEIGLEWTHGRMIETEENAKVVASAWGEEFIKFLL